jgi:signal transduction histidine kinase
VVTVAENVEHGSADALHRVAAVVVVGSVIAMTLAAAVIAGRPKVPLNPSPALLAAVVTFAMAGLTIAWARPRNTIGWLLIGAAALQAISLLGAAYAQAGYAAQPTWRGALVAAWLGSWTWFPSLALPVAVLPSVYPSGRPPSGRSSGVAVAGALGTVLVSLSLAAPPGNVGDIVRGLRLSWWQPPSSLRMSLAVVGFGLLAVAVIGGLVAAVVRTWHASGPERQQLAWFVTALTPLSALLFVPFHGGLEVSYALIGVAVAVGVLRYHLLDITVAVRRTLLYVPLTWLVALAVVAVSNGIRHVAPAGRVPIVGAAAVVAVLIGPVTRSLRRLVDRFVLGNRVDPLAVVESVAASTATGDDDPLGTVLEALARAVGSPYAGVVDRDGRRVAEIGDAPEAVESLPLQYDGQLLGELRIAVLRDETSRRILVPIAQQVATVWRMQDLMSELQAERERVVMATVTERDRIRRDLHDGLGPSLSGMSLALQAADGALATDPSAVRAILRRGRSEADAAYAEVRRVLDGLRPGALDVQRLPDAVAAVAQQLGLGRAGAPGFTLEADLATAIPSEVEEAAYRIASEALHNVARHASARQCTVGLHRSDGHLELTVADDGSGLPAGAAMGVGLESMRVRAQHAGGTLVVAPAAPGPGTVVRARLPLDAD